MGWITISGHRQSEPLSPGFVAYFPWHRPFLPAVSRYRRKAVDDVWATTGRPSDNDGPPVISIAAAGLLIAPLVQEVGDIVDTRLTNTGLTGHLLLGFFTDLFVIH